LLVMVAVHGGKLDEDRAPFNLNWKGEPQMDADSRR
jgi:hypothetical protein